MQTLLVTLFLLASALPAWSAQNQTMSSENFGGLVKECKDLMCKGVDTKGLPRCSTNSIENGTCRKVSTVKGTLPKDSRCCQGGDLVEMKECWVNFYSCTLIGDDPDCYYVGNAGNVVHSNDKNCASGQALD